MKTRLPNIIYAVITGLVIILVPAGIIWRRYVRKEKFEDIENEIVG